jgi:carbamoyl-phosphate synthase large subunit
MLRWSSTPPPGRRPDADGYAIRAAAIAADVTLITTVQELGAAVQGIESMRSAPMRVTSLQEHARALNLYGITTLGGVTR